MKNKIKCILLTILILGISFLFKNKAVKADSIIPTVSYKGIALGTGGSWDCNTTFSSEYYLTVVEFSGNLKNGGAADNVNNVDINLVNDLNYTIGLGLKLDGVSFRELSNNYSSIAATYLNGGCNLTIKIPKVLLDSEISEGYHTLTLDSGTTFYDAVLPSFQLYYYEGHFNELSYDEPNVTVKEIGAYGSWNNTISNGCSCNIIYFNENLDKASGTPGLTNYAQSVNFTSLGVKLNGIAFSELYKTNNQYSINYNHGAGYFYFYFPVADIIAGNGYLYPTIEVESGTPFCRSNLPYIKLEFINNKWVLKEVEANYLGINQSINNNDSKLSLNFNTNSFGNNLTVTDYSGIKFNNSDISSFINVNGLKTSSNNALTFEYDSSDERLYSDSIPVIEILDGAYITLNNVKHKLNPLKLFFNKYMNKWTDKNPEIDKTSYYLSVSEENNDKNNLIITFADFNTWSISSGNLLDYIVLDKTVTLREDGGTIENVYDNENLLKEIKIHLNGNYSKLEILEGASFSGVSLEPITLNLLNDKWSDKELIKFKNFMPEYDNLLQDGYYWVMLKFDTNTFEKVSEQKFPTNVKGITHNGLSFNNMGLVLWNEDTLWVRIEKSEEEAAFFNGYSHNTIKINEGASLVNSRGETIYFSAFECYLVGGSWTTIKPNDYVVYSKVEFDKVTESNKYSITIKYKNDSVWNLSNDLTALNNIYLDGTTKLSDASGNITFNNENKTLTFSFIGNYHTFIIEDNLKYSNLYLPALKLYLNSNYWDLIDGTLAPTVKDVGVPNDLWNNAEHIPGLSYLLFGFDKKLASERDYTNQASSINYQVSLGISLNGRTFNDLYKENNQVSISYQNGEWYLTICIPTSLLIADNGFEYPTIEVKGGTRFMDVILPHMEYVLYEGKWFEKTNFNSTLVEYSGIAPGWDNWVQQGYSSTILSFGTYQVDYFKNDDGTDARNNANNLAPLSTLSQVSRKVKINGRSLGELYEIDDSVICGLHHGYSFFYFVVPVYLLEPSNGYAITTLEIPENTNFYDRFMGGVTLYLYNGSWSLTKPDTFKETDLSYVGLADLTGLSELVMNDETCINLDYNTEINQVYKALFKVDSLDNLFAYNFLTNELNSGIQVTFKGNGTSEDVYLYYDKVIVSSGNFSIKENELYSLRIETKEIKNKLNITVIIDNVYIIDKTISKYDGTRNKAYLLNACGTNTFYSYREGDIKKPIPFYSGKDVYYFNEDTLIDKDIFLSSYTVNDTEDGKLNSSNIFVHLDDEEFNSGYLESGYYIFRIIAKDNSNNESITYINVVVNGSTKFVSISSNAYNDYLEIEKGSLIAEPQVSLDYENNEATYKFIGFYYLDHKWDFVNDRVYDDMDLVARYDVIYKEYNVTLKSEGLKTNYSYNFKLIYGSTIDKTLILVNGYNYDIYVNGVIEDRILITSDMDIVVKYSIKTVEEEKEDPSEPDEPINPVDPIEPDEPKKDKTTGEILGCKSSINLVSFIITLMIICFTLILKRKERSENNYE